MQTVLGAFGVAAVACWLLTPVVKQLAVRVGAVDFALSSRKIHQRPVARLGGAAVVAAFYATILALAAIEGGLEGAVPAMAPRLTTALLLAAGAIALLGLYDDTRGAGARLKFAVQFAIAAWAWGQGFRIEALSNPFGPALHLGWAGLPLTLVWIVGVTNALNLIDGVDGLATGVATIVLAVIVADSLASGAAGTALLAASLCGALVGFLRHNFHPASIFLGDTGSMFLGFVIAALSIAPRAGSRGEVALVVSAVLLGLPILDTSLALVRRFFRGTPLFEGDRAHIHHRLLDRGLSQPRVAIVLYAVSAGLAAAALLVKHAPRWAAGLVLAVLVLGAILGLRVLGYVGRGAVATLVSQRERNRALRNGLSAIGIDLRAASELVDVWRALDKGARRVLGAIEVQLRLGRGRAAGAAHEVLDAFHSEPTGSVAFKTVHPLRADRPGELLVLGWPAPGDHLDRDTELAVENLCRRTRSTLERLRRVGALGGFDPARDLRAVLLYRTPGDDGARRPANRPGEA